MPKLVKCRLSKYLEMQNKFMKLLSFCLTSSFSSVQLQLQPIKLFIRMRKMKLRYIRGIIFYHSGLVVQKTFFPIKDITLANSTHFSNLAGNRKFTPGPDAAQQSVLVLIVFTHIVTKLDICKFA
jgi:hypothetical protein